MIQPLLLPKYKPGRTPRRPEAMLRQPAHEVSGQTAQQLGALEIAGALAGQGELAGMVPAARTAETLSQTVQPAATEHAVYEARMAVEQALSVAEEL